jgi:hypothetical protein
MPSLFSTNCYRNTMLVRLTQATMEGTAAKVKVQNELSESFCIRNGLRQGDALACILFNIADISICR